MRIKQISPVLTAGFLLWLLSGIPVSATCLLLDAETQITWGDFSVKSVNADIETEYFNPALMLELRPGAAEKIGIGILFYTVKNDFTGDWDGDEGRHTEGEVTVDRTNFDLFVRFIPNKHFNVRLGYRYYNYEFTDGYLEKRQNGILIETADNARATGDLTRGIDLEFNFIAGDDIQFRLGIGAGYFFDAEYDWEYDRTQYDPDQFDRNEGSASHDAVAIRISPEMTFRLTEDLRLTIDYTLSGSIWDGTTDQADIEDYPGVEIFSAVGIGIEYRFGWNEQKKTPSRTFEPYQPPPL